MGVYVIVFLYISFSVGEYVLVPPSPPHTHTSCDNLQYGVFPFLPVPYWTPYGGFFDAGKIDLVKSKIGLGLTAFVTVVAGLTMSLGICTFFGLSISLSGR